ncbi:MAG: GNAT family N-acetyltransferase, partial [Thermodesulfobacteriota bacterium]
GEDLLFLESYKSSLRLANGKTIEFRPMLPSDEFSSRNFFYSLHEKTVYYRYFAKIRIFSHEMLQRQWASVDYRNNMSILGLVQKGGHKEIMAIASYAKVSDTVAEVAFVVKEELQHMGVGSYLLRVLEGIARENGFTTFTATVLRVNTAMIQVFKNRYPNPKITYEGSEMELTMSFDDVLPEKEKGGNDLGPG